MITNEIKAKVFAQYLGQNWKRPDGVVRDITIKELSWAWEFHIRNIGQYRVILRPLSEITDEDAIEVALLWPSFTRSGNYEVYENGFGNKVVSAGGGIKYEKFCIEADNLTPFAYQYLQSKGYDLPHFLLGGKTLKEAGLAIYESEINTK